MWRACGKTVYWMILLSLPLMKVDCVPIAGAPTWSWASLYGQVHFLACSKPPRVKLLHFSFTCIGPPNLGQEINASIRLSGPVLSAVVGDTVSESGRHAIEFSVICPAADFHSSIEPYAFDHANLSSLALESPVVVFLLGRSHGYTKQMLGAT
jgi:hypothetical protein